MVNLWINGNGIKANKTAFEEAKRMVAREAILAYPDFSKPFHIYTDASDYQLGAVIMQENKPLAFYTRKLNTAQLKYPTGEQELLNIVETLKSFENILLGQHIVVHTDHLNLLYKKLASNQMIRWRMMLEEFGPEFRHVKGVKNVVADALSRLPTVHKDDDIIDHEEQLPELSDVKTKDIKAEQFPMAPKLIAKEQLKDKYLQKVLKDDQKQRYYLKKVEHVELVHYRQKIYVPVSLRARIITWYHEYLVHPGQTQIEETIRSIFYWPGLRTQVEDCVKTRHACQLFKKNCKKYGQLPPKKAETKPWSRVNVDLIGPYTIKTPTKIYELRAMTMINPATSWFEISPINNPNSDTAQRVFDSMWLCRYPRPQECEFDNGSEFKWLFSELCDNFGIKKKTTSDYNPQSNAIIERVHQVLGNALRSFELEKRELEEENPFEPFMSAVAYLKC